jgi:hypothetical protein
MAIITECDSSTSRVFVDPLNDDWRLRHVPVDSVRYNERMTTKLRVHFDGRVLVPEEPVDLPIGESVEIQVGVATHESDGLPGTPSAVLAAALSEPHVSGDDVAELERTIANSKMSPANGIDFDGISQ